MIGRSGERGSGISVLAAQHGDDDDDDDEVILKLSPFIWALYISQTRFCLMEIEMLKSNNYYVIKSKQFMQVIHRAMKE